MNSFVNPATQPYQNPYTMYQNRYNNGITWVQGIEGAKAYQLTPNSNILLMDSENDGRFYIKVSDNVGMCSLRTFKYEEITDKYVSNSTDMSKYVTREEFETLVRRLGGLEHGKQSVSANDEPATD